MSIIAFWSRESNETGQTLSMVALSTYMSIEHNKKILDISTEFNNKTLENCFWSMSRQNSIAQNLTNNSQVGFESGIEGLIKIVTSNKTSNSIVSNYARVVFKDRFDVLCSSNTKSYEEYKSICNLYPQIIQVANKDYDLVFVDISKKMPPAQANKILQMADVIVINITQKLAIIDDYINLTQTNDFFKKNNIMLNIGRYDKFSKYNAKNVTRYIRLKKEISVIPYNTLFFEATSDSKVAEFFLRFRSTKETDRNATFIKETQRMSQDLLFKIQELQMKA